MNDHDQTAKDIAGKYKVSPRHILRLAETGQIPGVRIGKLWRFNAEEVRDALKQLTARTRLRESETEQ